MKLKPHTKTLPVRSTLAKSTTKLGKLPVSSSWNRNKLPTVSNQFGRCASRKSQNNEDAP